MSSFENVDYCTTIPVIDAEDEFSHGAPSAITSRASETGRD